MNRVRRHDRIAGLISNHPVRSQQELQELLEAEAIVVTQATLSRDLRALGVWKGPDGYRLPEGAAGAAVATMAGNPGDEGHQLVRALGRELVSAECSGTLVVLRTRPGHANALAVSLDGGGLDDVVGTIAGDDTVFVATTSTRTSREMADRLRTMAGHQ